MHITTLIYYNHDNEPFIEPETVHEEVSLDHWLKQEKNQDAPSYVASQRPMTWRKTIISQVEIMNELVSDLCRYSAFHLGLCLKAFVSLRDSVCTSPGTFITWYPYFTKLNKHPVRCCVSFIQASKEEILILSTDPNENIRSLGESLAKSHQHYKSNPVEFFYSKV